MKNNILEIEQIYPQPIETVWKAITDKDAIHIFVGPEGLPVAILLILGNLFLV